MKVVAHSLFVGAMTAWRAVACATMAIALSLVQGLWAQGPLTLEAIALADSGNLSEAENVLNGALSGPESGDAMTWYVHAFVLKERYVEGGSQPASLQQRAGSARRYFGGCRCWLSTSHQGTRHLLLRDTCYRCSGFARVAR